MAKLGLEREIVDQEVYDRAIAHCREQGICFPTFSQLAHPDTIPAGIRSALETVSPDEAHPLNLFRVHWYNSPDRQGFSSVPMYLEIPGELTGVRARIVVALGRFFPMIDAHKVLAAYGCLAPRMVTGQFDPTRHRAVWPSTGNYCRGGVAISRLMGCHGVAVLPEGMSRERFDWLDRWVLGPEDIIRTVGTESNVKEIYDACNALDQDPKTIIFNQFCEFGNYLVHSFCTGKALESVFRSLKKKSPDIEARLFVSATGSAGTIGAGDHLKRTLGTQIVAVEALECPTLLYNGFGEHNIQGIGDKHVPYIHNVMNTDFVVGISDEVTDTLAVLFRRPEGRKFLVERHGLDPSAVERLGDLGLSGICNVVAAIKAARYMDLGADDVVITVATDGADLYNSEISKAIEERFGGNFSVLDAAEIYGAHLRGLRTDHVSELTHVDRNRIFNLGYFTWVEQQGVSVSEFQARRDPSFWTGLSDLIPAWDARIQAFNESTGLISRYS